VGEVVSLAKCKDYEAERVADAVAYCLDCIDETNSILTEGKRVLIKPNLLSPRPPDEGVTTHPSVVKAVVDFVRKKGCQVRIGDSHGGYERKTEEVWEKTGMKSVSERTGAPLVNFEASGVCMKAVNGRKYPLSRAVFESDVLISLPRLKTHIVTGLTGAVKNMFGCVPGFRKAAYHRDIHSLERFCGMLVDVCQIVTPHITLMDTIISMDGNGPAGGRLRDSGLLIASLSPYTLDMGIAWLTSVEKRRVPTLAIAKRRGLGPASAREIEFAGSEPSECRIDDFRVPRGGELPPLLAAVVGRALWVRPRIDYSKCTSCGDCVKDCPVSAVKMQGDYPVIDLRRCFSCFCCQEMCAEGAISPIRSRHLKLLHR